MDYYFPEHKWMEINVIVETLQPLKESTIKLQGEQMTLSDFYGIWIQSKLKLQNLKNRFADTLLDHMCKREVSILESESMLGALYVDPRFQILLNCSQKTKAVKHLTSIWHKLELLNKEPVATTLGVSIRNETSNVDVRRSVGDFFKE